MMKALQCLQVFLVLLLSSLATAADNDINSEQPAIYHLHLGLGDGQMLQTLLLMPFKDMISLRTNARPYVYAQALAERSEFQSIDWAQADPLQLAKELWQFQLETPDTNYHKQLTTVLQICMEQRGVNVEIMREVQAILSQWVKHKARSRHYAKTKGAVRSPEAQKAIRERRRNRALEKKKEREQGRSLPLLEYMSFADPWTISTKDLFKEALKYRGYYKSSSSFIANLRLLWDTLGRNDGEATLYSCDAKSRYYPGWNQRGKAQASQGNVIAPQADEGAKTIMEKASPPQNEWNDSTFDGLCLDDLVSHGPSSSSTFDFDALELHNQMAYSKWSPHDDYHTLGSETNHASDFSFLDPEGSSHGEAMESSALTINRHAL